MAVLARVYAGFRCARRDGSTRRRLSVIERPARLVPIGQARHGMSARTPPRGRRPGPDPKMNSPR